MEIDRSGLEVLSPAECLRLLAASRWGRVAISVGALPAILPVRFVIDEDEILFRAGRNTALALGTRGEVVAFQVDGNHDELGQWSVLATGRLGVASGARAERYARLPIAAWALQDPSCFVELPIEVLSGRVIGARRRLIA